MPSAIKTAREYGDDLAVIFVEVQGAGPNKAERFAWDKRWMGTSAMWTSERPFSTGSRGIPNFALLSADGEVLMKGHPGSMHSKIMKAIDEEIANAKKGPADAPKALKSAYKSFGKGDYAKAFAATEKVVAKGGDDAAAAEAASKFFTKVIDKKFARVDWLSENGYLIQAEEVFGDLADGVKGLSAFDERVTALTELFDGDEMKRELKIAKSFNKLEATLADKGIDEKAAKKLAKFVEKNDGARVSARAENLLRIAKKLTEE
ncbi:MAG: hypothetical protein AAGG01_16270 [Planctomycetota bacterium]